VASIRDLLCDSQVGPTISSAEQHLLNLCKPPMPTAIDATGDGGSMLLSAWVVGIYVQRGSM